MIISLFAFIVTDIFFTVNSQIIQNNYVNFVHTDTIFCGIINMLGVCAENKGDIRKMRISPLLFVKKRQIAVDNSVDL